jgi:hypothetical protein
MEGMYYMNNMPLDQLIDKYKQEILSYSKKVNNNITESQNKVIPTSVVPESNVIETKPVVDTYNQFLKENPKTGYLKVEVFAANRALPITNARVTVSKKLKDEQRMLKVLLTDINGQTETIPLPAPDKLISEKPGMGIPYSTYTIKVEQPNFLPLEDFDVPIFEGITSIQPVELTPTTILDHKEETVTEKENL